jgi:predicted RNA binding protein YcfA (HicA-like mRNA interferase family)
MRLHLERKPQHSGAMKVRNLIEFLRNDGWYRARSRGSHRQFRYSAKSGRIIVAGKTSAGVPPGTLNAILKQARLKS